VTRYYLLFKRNGETSMPPSVMEWTFRRVCNLLGRM
jgi:hypothetical protein